MLKKIFLRSFLNKYYVLWIIFFSLEQFIYSILPILTWKYVNFIDTKNLWDDFHKYIYLGLFLVFLLSLRNIVYGLLSSLRSNSYKQRESDYVYNKFLNLDYDKIISEWTGKLLTKVNSWINRASTIIGTYIRGFLVIFIRLSFAWVFLVKYMWFFSLFLFIFTIFIFLVNKLIKLKIKTLTDKEQEINENIWDKTNLIISEFSLLRVSNMGKQEVSKLLSFYEVLKLNNLKLGFLNNIVWFIMEYFFYSLEILAYFYFWYLVVEWKFTLWEIITFIWFIWLIRWPITTIMDNLSTYRENKTKLYSLYDFIEEKQTIIDWENDFEFKVWNIKFENIDFSYKDKEIFKDLNLEIGNWQISSFVWYSWAWKSTIVKLILRLYDSNNWKILIDWQDLKTLKKDTFYKHIWYLSQESAIFNWTLKENLIYLLWEENDLSDTDLYEILKKVYLYDTISTLKDWLQTQVWEKWIKLSWWEKQKLAIARILLKNPEIIIFDEPTSALDSISESHINSILKEFFKWKTVIIIAHRLQTVLDSDNIFVFDKWKIMESWNHKFLIKNNWLYSQMIDLQSGIIKDKI